MREKIQTAIEEVLASVGVLSLPFVVEHPADRTHGDFATNVALLASKDLKKPPREVAEMLVSVLATKLEGIATVSIAGPGFINFVLSRSFLSETIARIGKDPRTWGRNHSMVGKKIIVEYTDPNPFKEFHIGHLFTNTVGESIARLFMMQGATVSRVNYQGDVGLHVAHAVWGMQELGIAPDASFSSRDLGRAYAHGATAYKNEDPRAVREIREINKKVYDRSDANINALYDRGREVSLAYFETIYAMVDTQFDAYFFESEAGLKGRDVVLANPTIFVESDGARVFKGEEHGLHTRVFVNKEGLPTYEAKELALARMKEERLGAYDLSIISTSNEINEYFKVLVCAMSQIYPELAKKTEHLGHGTVRLASGKMSSRTGDVISALDFIDEVAESVVQKMNETGKVAPTQSLARDIALSAIKYATLRGDIHHDSIFDKEQALSFEGDSGPYLAYTHARIVSVLARANEAGVSHEFSHVPETPYELERILYRFPEVALEACLKRAPHKVTNYLIEVASAFNHFYSAEKIADSTDVYAPYKVAVADAVRATLKNGLWVLGIKAPDQM